MLMTTFDIKSFWDDTTSKAGVDEEKIFKRIIKKYKVLYGLDAYQFENEILNSIKCRKFIDI